MKVAGSIALVTGANRGLGLAFAKVLVEMGAAKVYAAARNPQVVTLTGVVPLKLDVTSDEDAAAAARTAGNINLLINNAGIARPGSFLADGAIEAAREQFEVNFVGSLRVARAFAPVLAKNGGGAIINVLSVASWMNGPTKFTSNCSRAASTAPSARKPPGLAMPALLISRLMFAATRAAATTSSSLVTSSFSGTTPIRVTAFGLRAAA